LQQFRGTSIALPGGNGSRNRAGIRPAPGTPQNLELTRLPLVVRATKEHDDVE
jgi:hypothetical protein